VAPVDEILSELSLACADEAHTRRHKSGILIEIHPTPPAPRSDLDLDGGCASIGNRDRRQAHSDARHTKTAKGRRTVTLDKGTVAALREHRKRQAAERLLMGAGWTDHDLVLCRVYLTMLHPERFTRGLSEAVGRLVLPPSGPHERHGWATLAVAGWYPSEGGSGAVGPRQHRHHAGHLQPRRCGLHEAAAEQVAALFRNPVSNP
jgi:hypothetical protein